MVGLVGCCAVNQIGISIIQGLKIYLCVKRLFHTVGERVDLNGGVGG